MIIGQSLGDSDRQENVMSRDFYYATLHCPPPTMSGAEVENALTDAIDKLDKGDIQTLIEDFGDYETLIVWPDESTNNPGHEYVKTKALKALRYATDDPWDIAIVSSYNNKGERCFMWFSGDASNGEPTEGIGYLCNLQYVLDYTGDVW
jgi:hypothetical protein